MENDRCQGERTPDKGAYNENEVKEGEDES